MSQIFESRTEVGKSVHEPPGLLRLTARPAISETGSTDLEDRLDEARLGALSRAVSKLVGDYGRTPSRATTWVIDELCVVTALEDFMIPAEHRLVAQDQTELVKHLRHGFGEAITDQYVRAAERALGRRVISHQQHGRLRVGHLPRDLPVGQGAADPQTIGGDRAAGRLNMRYARLLLGRDYSWERP